MRHPANRQSKYCRLGCLVSSEKLKIVQNLRFRTHVSQPSRSRTGPACSLVDEGRAVCIRIGRPGQRRPKQLRRQTFVSVDVAAVGGCDDSLLSGSRLGGRHVAADPVELGRHGLLALHDGRDLRRQGRDLRRQCGCCPDAARRDARQRYAEQDPVAPSLGPGDDLLGTGSRPMPARMAACRSSRRPASPRVRAAPLGPRSRAYQGHAKRTAERAPAATRRRHARRLGAQGEPVSERAPNGVSERKPGPPKGVAQAHENGHVSRRRGHVAEWLRSGLQIRLRGFDSLRGLQFPSAISMGWRSVASEPFSARLLRSPTLSPHGGPLVPSADCHSVDTPLCPRASRAGHQASLRPSSEPQG